MGFSSLTAAETRSERHLLHRQQSLSPHIHPPHSPLRPSRPAQHYVKTNGGLKPGEALRSYFGAVPDHLK